MIKKLSTILAVLTAVSLLLTGCGATKKVRMGTAGIGGNYYNFGSMLSSLFDRDKDGFYLDVKETAGSEANIRLLTENYIQLAIVQADVANDALNGKNEFKGKGKSSGFKAICSLYTEACQIVVRADSDIISVEDLIGKTVSVGENESGTMQNAKQILLANGISLEMINPQYLSYSESANRLNDKSIDAFFCTAGTATSVISTLASSTGVRLLSVDDSTISRLTDTYAFYSPYIIPANTYNGQNEDIKTVGVKAILLASERLASKTVYKIIEKLLDNAENLQAVTPTLLELDKASLTKGVTIPFHEGAREYFKDKGIKTETEEKS